MDLRIPIVGLILALSSQASGDIITEVNSVELTISNISMPTAANGRLMFRPCAGDCEENFTITRLTENTRFMVRGESLTFIEFRNAFQSIRRNQSAYALVSYHVKDKTVLSVDIGEQ